MIEKPIDESSRRTRSPDARTIPSQASPNLSALEISHDQCDSDIKISQQTSIPDSVPDSTLGDTQERKSIEEIGNQLTRFSADLHHQTDRHSKEAASSLLDIPRHKITAENLNGEHEGSSVSDAKDSTEPFAASSLVQANFIPSIEDEHLISSKNPVKILTKSPVKVIYILSNN